MNEQPAAPAPVNREAVKVLAQVIGIREAARRMGLNEERVLKWSQRDPAGPWGAASAPPVPVRGPAPVVACPQNVRTASEALDSALKDDETATRISLSRAARNLASQAESADLSQSGDALQAGKLAALVHRWADDKSATVNVSIFASSSPVEEVPVIDV
jgi:hypothetical protein